MVVVMIFRVWNGAVLCVFVIAPPAEKFRPQRRTIDDRPYS